MSRNANGEGTICDWMVDGKKRGYRGALSYCDEHGAAKRFYCYGRTRAEVKDKLDQARKRVTTGGPVKDAKLTVGEWMAQWRESGLAVSDRKESTRVMYASLSRTHIEPAPFGGVTLDKLKPSHIDKLILALRSKTKPGKPTTNNPSPAPVRALSDSSIRQVYTVLRAGLDGAVRDRLIATNPCAAVRRPGVPRTEARYLDTAAVGAVLDAAKESRHYSALALVVATGLRKGEALGLRWSDVNLDDGWLKVRQTLNRIQTRLVATEPKTDRSRRTVPLSPAVVAMLRRHKVAQTAERLKAGDQWTDSGLVFTTEFGGPVDPRNLLRVAEVAAAKAGQSGVGVHTLRHSAAVGWLEAGVHIKAVADLLGHSSIAVTGDVYGHTSDDAARSAVDGWAVALGL